MDARPLARQPDPGLAPCPPDGDPRGDGDEAPVEVRIEDLARTVQAIHMAAFGKNSSFHLHACGRCDAPSWQQPCPCCGYYPMGNPADEAERAAHALDRDRYERICEHQEGIGAWYFAGFSRTVAYSDPTFPGRSAFRAQVAEAVARCAAFSFPPPGDIWDATRDGGRLQWSSRKLLIEAFGTGDEGRWDPARVREIGERELAAIAAGQAAAPGTSGP
jgi:hypothetical protein